jgi:hypothetical protein
MLLRTIATIERCGAQAREDNTRPAIDPMLRPAAVSCGSRAVGLPAPRRRRVRTLKATSRRHCNGPGSEGCRIFRNAAYSLEPSRVRSCRDERRCLTTWFYN